MHWQVYGRKCKVGPYESSTNLSSQIPKRYSLGGSQGMPMQFNKLSTYLVKEGTHHDQYIHIE